MLNKLRRRYPAAQLDWLVTPAIAELLRHNPAITNVIEFAREDWSRPWTPAPFVSYARLAAKLRANGYDLVVDMHGQFRTAVFALATGAPVRIGFDRPRARVWDASPRTFSAEARKHAWQGAREGSWLAYTDHIPVPTLDLHAVDRYLSVGPILGLEEGPARFFFSHSASGKRQASSRCCVGMTSPAGDWSPWRRARSGKPSTGEPTSSPKLRGTSCERVSPWR